MVPHLDETTGIQLQSLREEGELRVGEHRHGAHEPAWQRSKSREANAWAVDILQDAQLSIQSWGHQQPLGARQRLHDLPVVRQLGDVAHELAQGGTVDVAHSVAPLVLCQQLTQLKKRPVSTTSWDAAQGVEDDPV